MGDLVSFLTRNPILLLGLVILIWAIRKAASRPADPRNDPPDRDDDWSNEDEMSRWM